MDNDLFGKDFLRKLEYLDLIAKRLVFGRQQAARPSVKKGASIEFKDFREYTPGDDPRTVDWSAYARLGELFVKLFRQEEELDLYVLLDSSQSMAFGEPDKFDYARQIAAALAYIGLSNMDSAAVLPFHASLNTGLSGLRGRGQIFGLLDFLRELRANGSTDLSATVRTFASRIRRPGLVVLVSDFYGLSDARGALDRLRFLKHEIYVIQVTCPWELDPPIRGELRLVDVESSQHEDLTVTDSMLRRYNRLFSKHAQDLRRYAMRYALGYAQARSDVRFDDFILDLLRRGGLVA